MIEIIQFVLVGLAVLASLIYILIHLKQALLHGEENEACSHCPLNKPPRFTSANN